MSEQTVGYANYPGRMPVVGDIVSIHGETDEEYKVIELLPPNALNLEKPGKTGYIFSELNLITPVEVVPPSPDASIGSLPQTPSFGDVNISGSPFSPNESGNTTNPDVSDDSIRYTGNFSPGGGKRRKSKRRTKRKLKWDNKATVAVVATTLAFDKTLPPTDLPDPSGGKNPKRKSNTRKKPRSLKKRIR